MVHAPRVKVVARPIHARRTPTRGVERFTQHQPTLQTGLGPCLCLDPTRMWWQEDTFTRLGETPSSQQFTHRGRLDRVSPHLLNGRVYLRSPHILSMWLEEGTLLFTR